MTCGCRSNPVITAQLKVHMGVVESFVSGTNSTLSIAEVQRVTLIRDGMHSSARAVCVKHVPKLLREYLRDCYRRYV
jgi:hypothetical protein